MKPELKGAGRVVEDIEAMLRMASQLSRPDSMLIDQLIGVVITRTSVEAVGAVLQSNAAALTDAHLQRLAHLLAGEQVAPNISLEGERLSFYAILQRLYTDNGEGDGHLLPEAHAIIKLMHTDWKAKLASTQLGEYLLAPLINAANASRKDVVAKYEEIYDSETRRFAQPYWKPGSRLRHRGIGWARPPLSTAIR
ncbi:MAG: hypothetical protein QF878_07700 [SAR202 cluster bacterium]|jgi:hypothetical protein|nr:hypothetical protein [Planctomycetota bacterium]MDP6513053.1 hypothetical protein [SAR202 cluster bacterium]